MKDVPHAQAYTVPAVHAHPLDPLSPVELERACGIVKANRPTQRLFIKSCQLREPPKAELVPYLNAERAGTPLPPPARQADVLFFDLADRSLTESIINLDTGSETSEVVEGHHAAHSKDEIMEAREQLFKDPTFLETVAKLNLPPVDVVVAPWPVGADNTSPQPRRIAWILYCRGPSNHPDSNQYAFPLPPVIFWNVWDKRVDSVEWCYTGGEGDAMVHKPLTGKSVIEGMQPGEYLPELNGLPRRELKPLHVTQPQGVSFSVNGNLLEWQKWRFRIGFNAREGPVLHDVTYDGRRVFYRLSLSEMHVPYGDPRPPLHLKQVFDFGDVGLGRAANSLENGCDCLGSMRYFSWADVNSAGRAFTAKNVVCCHEQDNGILWKHTNSPTGRATVVRQRLLVLQTIITVGNYDYIFAWQFDQAGGIHLETRATGILSTSPIDMGKTSPYGTVVSPGVLGTSHQHFISVRIDPSIDGDANTITQDDVVADPWGPENPHGVGFRVSSTPIAQSGWADAAPDQNRVFKIQNRSVINPITMTPVGYKLVPLPSQMRLSQPDAMITSRAPFTQHHVWVTSYKDGELYAAGKYTNQSNGKAGGLETMVARKDNTLDTDVVLWHTFALTHIPRIEDFPVMPVETHTVSLKPNNFFTSNPALDVPLSTQAFNKSTLAECSGCPAKL
ncbi:uncharacterized protein CcaverHIS019_0300680 [Cutaneotrichosporon cavernicola]|uniref:Amine oxidase n=1 Tax=Cutaneotrichosporon cavernicola TaxID=279322 RepID=A0AA48IGE6_9TREE|nr:uncharacterized protein CcaverHIS019_0300680 [Cutaneotrichosporon cavernicola]BEI89998.1 hypothetical protein CcaverHIS019_0300680 [Cutaneotrichosporon cavernicola]BEI97770.1 hypothetical protein CcaverHIS631_0300690 [Cutaneotrichosporon cavernicola]BEJ05548.1 hypothetical protein CcaverHIS641_0300700 [Cutaneotrichosporon cavernicola]